MGWWRTLTLAQRRILAAMTAALLLVLAMLGWAVYSTMEAVPVATATPPPPATATPTATATPAPTAPPTPDITTAGRLAQEVAAARGLVPRWETPLTLVDLHDLSVFLYRRYQAQPPFPLSAYGALETLGLCEGPPPTPDPVAQAKAAAALFDPQEGTINLRRDWEGETAVWEEQLAYAYALALTDQLAGLDRLRHSDLSLDQQLALEGFAHGEALYTLHRYLDAPISTLTPTLAPALFPLWRQEDPQAVHLARLPLEIGAAFATRAAEPLLDDALQERPPRSTAQLLHPQDYSPSHPFYPFEPIYAALGPSWEVTLTETMGEALMREALAAWGAPEAAENLRGWDGDLLQVWEDDEGHRVALWQMAWLTGRDAAHVAAALREIIPHHLVRGLIRDRTLAVGLPSGEWWASTQGAAYLRRYADQVWLVWGDDVPTVEQVAGSLP